MTPDKSIASPDAEALTFGWPDVLTVTGSDAEKFLQAQLTCDVRKVSPGKGIPFAWCTPAGRIRASGWLISAGQSFYLLLGNGSGSSNATDLARFILRDKVSIDAGKHAIHVRDSDDLADPFDVRLPGIDLDPLVLSRDAARYDSVQFLLAGIRAGVCELPASLADRYIPQMLNLDLTGGISFTKGCYPGQEIIARTQNLGRVKRRMLRFSSVAPAPAAGTPVFSGRDQVGDCVRSASDNDGCELLAVVRLDSGTGTLRLGETSGPPLQPLPLPYAIPGVSA